MKKGRWSTGGSPAAAFIIGGTSSSFIAASAASRRLASSSLALRCASLFDCMARLTSATIPAMNVVNASDPASGMAVAGSPATFLPTKVSLGSNVIVRLPLTLLM